MRKEENGEACGDRSSPLLVRMEEKVCVKIRLENKGMRGPTKGDGGNDKVGQKTPPRDKRVYQQSEDEETERGYMLCVVYWVVSGFHRVHGER